MFCRILTGSPLPYPEDNALHNTFLEQRAAAAMVRDHDGVKRDSGA
jgi:hypothetical protein